MAAANYQSSEDQFLCSICLDVFNDPVTITCGHNFCKRCIHEHWNCTDQHSCPICKKVFNSRPELNINTLLSEMAAQFKQSAQQKTSSCSSSDQAAAKPGEVPCDVCPGPKLKALKSCLVCLVSYCETHLEPHLTVAGLKRHQLMDPVENLESRMCLKHDKLLELFCRTEQTCVCMLCTVLDHKTHDVVPLREECEEKKAELVKTEAEIQQMIQKRRLKIQETEQSVKLSGTNADKVIAEGVQVFTALKDSVDRSLNELIKTIKEKQKSTEKQAEESIQKLEQEISELKKRSSVVERLSQTEDHLHLLQSFPSLDAPQATKDWTDVSVHPSSYEGTVVRAVSQLEETIREEVKKLLDAELKRVQQYAVDVTLDSDEDILEDHQKGFSFAKHFISRPRYCPKKSIATGRFYFEAEVKGKTKWTLGVIKHSVTEDTALSPEDGCYIWLTNGNEYKALTDPQAHLSLRSQPQKVGVFVDYEEGLVSFFDVDTAALIYSFTGCSFTEKLYPYFCPCNNDDGKNSAPLTITTTP
ncbi:uncharacterized protein V6R79_017510 [Siganus canaliculatus]